MATRHNGGAATRVFAETHERVYEHGRHVNTIASHYSKIPRWVTCEAEEFERVWEPKFRRGELPACSDAEWKKIKGMFHSDTVG